MKYFIIFLFITHFLFAQNRTFSDQNYVAIDSVKGVTISNTAYAFAADRVYFGSWYVCTSAEPIYKIRLKSQPALGSPTTSYKATIYNHSAGSTNPTTVRGVSIDSVNYTILNETGTYWDIDFRFSPAISGHAVGDTIIFGPSATGWSSSHYWNVGRYTDAALSGTTVKSADQSSWTSYLSDPLAVIVYTVQQQSETESILQHPEWKGWPGWTDD